MDYILELLKNTGMDEIKRQFAAAVRHCIKIEYGWHGGQKALALDAGVYDSDISATVNEKFDKMPGQDKQYKIAKACGYSLAEFLLLGSKIISGKIPNETIEASKPFDQIDRSKNKTKGVKNGDIPFPRYMDIMALPVPKRPWAIKSVAADANGIHGWSESAGDLQLHENQETPREHQRYFDGEITEIDLYNQYDRYFKKLVEKLKKGLEEEVL